MMTDKLKQIAQEEIMKLPKEAQEAINSLDWGNIMEEIGKKYLFDENEINDLQTETLLVLVGLENGDDYAQNIENNVGTSKGEAEKIVEDAFQKVFTPINDLLVENIKKSDKSKNPNWKQSLEFILSGGDYSAFIAPSENEIPTNVDEPNYTNNMLNLKGKFNI
ncbi:MAG: hypothetical protein WCG28_00985 [bacterium]